MIEQSNKFKTNYLNIRFLLPVSKENATLSALLSIYLVYLNDKRRDYASASYALQGLYSMRFDINTTLKGDKICFDFVSNFVASKYLNNETYIKDVLDEFLTYIYQPYTVDGAFEEEIFEVRKFDLENRIKSAYDDKGTYAYNQFSDLFGKDTAFAIKMSGYLDILEDITPKSLQDFYQSMIEQVPVVGGMIDDQDYQQINDLLREKIPSVDKDEYLNFYRIENREPVQVEIESQDIVQSKLYMGFNINNKLIFSDHYSKLVFTSLFGLTSNSFLFKIVREQENLCYSIRANYDFYSNTVSVMAGIDKTNYEKTKDLVIQLKDKVASGDFSDEQLTDAKTVLIDMFEKQKDSQENSINYQMNRIQCGLIPDLNKDIQSVLAVTKEDVIRVGQKLHLNTIYLLSGDKHE